MRLGLTISDGRSLVEPGETTLMYDLFRKPVARFLAGFFFACFFIMPVVLVAVGLPNLLVVLALFFLAGIAGGFWWMRRPPPIFYKSPVDVLVDGAGVFSRPGTRFLAGFFFACLIFFSDTWVIRGPPSSFYFLAPMGAVGIVCGVMAARRSAAIFW